MLKEACRQLRNYKQSIKYLEYNKIRSYKCCDTADANDLPLELSVTIDVGTVHICEFCHDILEMMNIS